MAYVIGIDSSTTATKAVVWDRDGRAVAEGRSEFALALPRPGWHEQDPEDWWSSCVRAVTRALESADGAEIEALCVTHQRETFACVDEQGRPVRPAIVWMDVRATDQVAALGSEEIHRLTGKPPDTTPALYKLLWLREHEPETLERARWVVDVHAFVVHRLTGVWRTTTACADPLGLIDMHRGDWSDELLARVGLSRDELTVLTDELGLSESQKTKAQTILDVVQRSKEMIVLQQDEARRQRALQRLEAHAQRALGAIVSGEQQALLDRHFAGRDREGAP